MKWRGWGAIVSVLLLWSTGCKDVQSGEKYGTAEFHNNINRGGFHTGSNPEQEKSFQVESERELSKPGKSDRSEMLQKMGIEVEDGRITIDTKRAGEYLRKLERQISYGVDRGMKKAKQNASEVDDVGIYVGKERIEIDLNKTKNFLRIWGESMKILGEELDRSLQSP